MRTVGEFKFVTALVALGYNDCQIARSTAIPRETVRDWRRGISTRRERTGDRCQHDFWELPAHDYAYLLGLYLGDGCISKTHRDGVWKLRVVLDARYVSIIAECKAAIEAVVPNQRAHIQPRKTACVEVSMYSKHWPCLFPQHGPGRKHEREIALADWQEEIVAVETKAFLRGLIHSDGCRVVANDRGTESVRYHFSNRSEDIKGLFCAALDRLAIPWTRPCNRQIAIYRKAAVGVLDSFIGPKM